MKKTFITICERSLAILSYIFAFVEISSCFAIKVFLNADSKFMKYLYVTYVAKMTNFYIENVYIIFALMLGIFILCSRGTIPATKYLRFNVIQAILLNIICSCISAVFPLIPVGLRESSIGLLLANFIYIGMITLIVYSSILIFFGRYPRIPVLSEAARLQVQRGYLE